jgi:RimJ/RimL family protein N-acetyltransferase
MLTFRTATQQDVDLFFNWANDPVTRQNSYNKGAVDYDTHVNWFQKKNSSPDAIMYVFQIEGQEPVGQIRFDRIVGTNDFLVSISVDSNHRGKGYASQMLTQSADRLLAENPGAHIIAHVFVSNKASYRSFVKAGYQLVDKKEISGIESYILEKT